MEVIELFDNLRLGMRAANCTAGISELDDYAGDGVAIRTVKALQDTVILIP